MRCRRRRHCRNLLRLQLHLGLCWRMHGFRDLRLALLRQGHRHRVKPRMGMEQGKSRIGASLSWDVSVAEVVVRRVVAGWAWLENDMKRIWRGEHDRFTCAFKVCASFRSSHQERYTTSSFIWLLLSSTILCTSTIYTPDRSPRHSTQTDVP